MFEHTLAGSMPSDRSFRFGPASAAVAIHAGVLIAVLAVSWLTLHPVEDPKAPMIFTIFPQPPVMEERPVFVPPAPRAGGSSENRAAPALPPPVPPPETTPEQTFVPDDVAPPAVQDTPAAGEGASLDVGTPGNGHRTGTGLGIGDGADPAGNGPGGTGTGSDPIAIGPGIASPRLIFKVQPEYPPVARKSRLEGRVVLRAVVGPDGNVTSVELVDSSNAMFNQAAIDAVRQWRYTPPSQNGRPVSVWLNVMVKFTLS